MKCDSGQPGCLICAAYGDACQYDKAPPVSQVVTMAKRLKQYEDAISQLQNVEDDEVQQILDGIDGARRDSIDGTSPYQPSEAGSSQEATAVLRQSDIVSQPGRAYGEVASSIQSDLSISSDGQLRYYGSTSAVHQPAASLRRASSTATDFTEDDSRSLLVNNASQSRNWEEFALGNAALQLDFPRDTITRLLDTHWTWIHPVFMFVYRPAFISDMSTGGPYFSHFLLSVLCSHSTRFIEKQLSEILLSRARLLMGKEIHKESSIPTIQGLLQFSAREMGQGAVSQAWLYSGMAFRMATDLGLHLSTDRISSLGHLNAQDKEIRTRLAWACYLWDKAMSLYLGRLPTIQEPPADEPTFLDDFAETELWAPYYTSEQESSAHPPYPPTMSHSISCFTNLCKLGVIVNDIMVHLYSRRKATSISAFVQRARRKLDDWRRASEPHLVMDPHALPPVCSPPHILTQK